VKKQWRLVGTLCVLILGAGLFPALAGDSVYGKVTKVKSATVVTLDNGEDAYNVRLVGVEVSEAFAEEARQLLADLVLGKNARIRFEGQAPNGDMVSRLLADDPVLGVKDVGVELVRAGLVKRQKDYDYKYGELSTAENEARVAKRGLWAQAN